MATIKYALHVQDIGWGFGEAQDGIAIGTTGLGKRAECIRFGFEGLPQGTVLQYRAHVEGYGWLEWVDVNQEAGTTGQDRRMEAIQFRWINNPDNCIIFGRCHVSSIGWQDIADTAEGDGIFGTTGQGRQIEAVQFCIVTESIDAGKIGVPTNQRKQEIRRTNLQVMKDALRLTLQSAGCLTALNRTIVLCSAPVPFTCEAGGIMLVVSCKSAVETGIEVFNREGGRGDRPHEGGLGTARNGDIGPKGTIKVGPPEVPGVRGEVIPGTGGGGGKNRK